MRIIVTYGIKYEPQWLVDEIRENLKWADGFAEVDCRDRTHEMWIDESEYRKLQRAECAKLKADWVLVTSPDERWDARTGPILRRIARRKHKTIYSFNLREMWTPTAYRVDGIWGRKIRPRFYAWYDNQVMTGRRIQSKPTPLNRGYDQRLLDVDIYHLKQIEPESRIGRALTYEALDPDYKMQPRERSKLQRIDPEGKFKEQGYHYLYDETGLQLQEIPANRAFTPPYTKKYIFHLPKKCDGCVKWVAQYGRDLEGNDLCERCWSASVE